MSAQREGIQRSILPIPDRQQVGLAGTVKGVQIAIADAAENSDHLVAPEEAIRIAVARQ